MNAKEKAGSYRKLRLPDTRRITIDLLDATSRKHWMTGLIKVDVTRAREAQARMSGDERPPSLTTWVVKCISQGAAEHPEVHGARRGRGLVIFDDVDISGLIESERHGKKVPRPCVIRKTKSRSLKEISGEMETFKSKQKTDDLVLGNRKGAAGTGREVRLQARGSNGGSLRAGGGWDCLANGFSHESFARCEKMQQSDLTPMLRAV